MSVNLRVLIRLDRAWSLTGYAPVETLRLIHRSFKYISSTHFKNKAILSRNIILALDIDHLNDTRLLDIP